MSGGAAPRLVLRHPRGETRILAGHGALAEARDELAAWLSGRRLFVVTTPRVLALHGGDLAPLAAAALAVETLVVEDGEGAKTVAEAGRLWEAMLRAGGKRDSRLVTFGGGSVGDLGGFVAGCFVRGIRYAHLPTTLLAQVDASIGGKTAVDLAAGKNAVGLFHHPDLVIADSRWLATLPPAELRAGLMEVVKVAFLLRPAFFERLERDLDALLEGDAAVCGPVVREAAALKAAVVERDPEEGGERRLLNFGHTLGHAIEAAAGYSGLRHGDAVGHGMRFALRLAARRGLPPEDAGRLERLLARCRLPPLPAVGASDVLRFVERDKKGGESGVPWVLPVRLGEGRVVGGVPSSEVAAELERFLAEGR